MRAFTRLASLCAFLILSGCWDKVELNERAYVNSISVDKSNAANERFSVGVAVTDLRQRDGELNGEENKSVKKSSGSAVSSAIRQSETGSSQRLFFGYTKALFLGSPLLQDSMLFREALDAFERDREISRKLLILVSEGEAASIIETRPQGEPSIGVFTENFYKVNNTGNTIRMNLEDLLVRLRSDGNAVLPLIRADKDELEIGGMAVIRNLKLQGYLNEKETRGFLWQTGRVNGAKVVTEFEGMSIPFTVLSHKKRISFYETDNGLVMKVSVEAGGSLDEYLFGKSVYSESRLRRIEKLIGEEIRKEIDMANKAFKNRLQTDGMNTGGMLKKKNYELWSKYKDWQTSFENMEVCLEVNVNVKSIGLIK